MLRRCTTHAASRAVGTRLGAPRALAPAPAAAPAVGARRAASQQPRHLSTAPAAACAARSAGSGCGGSPDAEGPSPLSLLLGLCFGAAAAASAAACSEAELNTSSVEWDWNGAPPDSAIGAKLDTAGSVVEHLVKWRPSIFKIVKKVPTEWLLGVTLRGLELKMIVRNLEGSNCLLLVTIFQSDKPSDDLLRMVNDFNQQNHTSCLSTKGGRLYLTSQLFLPAHPEQIENWLPMYTASVLRSLFAERELRSAP